MLAISFKGYNSIVDEGKKKWIKIYDTSNLFIKGVKYDKWYELFKDKSKSQPEETISEGLNGDDEDLSNMSPLERKDKKTKIRARKNYGWKSKIDSFKKINNSNRIKNIISEQIIKVWKQFIQIKK